MDDERDEPEPEEEDTRRDIAPYMPRRPVMAVIGNGLATDSATEAVCVELGRRAVEAGFRLVTGGSGASWPPSRGGREATEPRRRHPRAAAWVRGVRGQPVRGHRCPDRHADWAQHPGRLRYGPRRCGRRRRRGHAERDCRRLAARHGCSRSRRAGAGRGSSQGSAWTTGDSFGSSVSVASAEEAVRAAWAMARRGRSRGT